MSCQCNLDGGSHSPECTRSLEYGTGTLTHDDNKFYCTTVGVPTAIAVPFFMGQVEYGSLMKTMGLRGDFDLHMVDMVILLAKASHTMDVYNTQG